jgi:glucokinase
VEGSNVTNEIKVPTVANASKEEIITSLIKGIEELNHSEVIGIGIGVPGLIDEERGIIYDLFNIPSWKEVHLKERLEQHFEKPVRITNDANVFAMGEKTFGEGAPYKNFVGVTLGTGFGTGIIIHDELYSGTLSSAGEVGSIPYLDATIEDYCSAKFFARKGGLDGVSISEKAKQGDSAALDIFEEYGSHLGNALKIIMNILSPEAILLGGSIAGSYPFFQKSLEQKINTFPFKRVLERFTVKPSETENIAILGAAALVLSPENISLSQNYRQT